MNDCTHEFIYDEQLGEAVCRKCGYELTAADKREILHRAFEKMMQEKACEEVPSAQPGDSSKKSLCGFVCFSGNKGLGEKEEK